MANSTTQYINLDYLYSSQSTSEIIPASCWLHLEARHRRVRNLEKWNVEYKVSVLLKRTMLIEKVRMLTKKAK